jgi:glycerol-3-phosphate dehydrogenase (NAD(P)+)
MTLRVSVIGSGTFGRAIAKACARNKHEVWLHSRRDQELPGLRTITELSAVRDRELIFIATPARHTEELAAELGRYLDGSHLVVHVSRGLVGPELKPITTVLREHTAARRLGALAGPLVADALAEDRPGGAIVGTAFPEVARMVRMAIAGETLRIDDTRDVQGVQFASATAGLLTVVLGYAVEAGTDPGAVSILATRGMNEAARLSELFGAKRETFMTLAGLGDLIAAVAGDERPEFRLGRALAQGTDVDRAIGEVGAYVEGVQVARHLITQAERLGLKTPIFTFFVSVLDGHMEAKEAVRTLMSMNQV